MEKKIVVIGKNGQVAMELAHLDKNADFYFFGREDIDITSVSSIEQTIGNIEFDALINASAYTAVDKAESEIEQANEINVLAVKNLVDFCKRKNIHFTHISTDYVFSGDKGSPYLENDPYGPQSIYGESKMLGERYIIENYPENSCILRTSWVYSRFGNNFVKTMLSLMASKEQLSVIDDQVGSPTCASLLAAACIEAANQEIAGIYHWTDEGVCSWYDFALEIQRQGIEQGILNKAIPILPIPTTDYPTPATRPAYSVLSKVNTRRVFSSKNKHWAANLSHVVNSLKTSN